VRFSNARGQESGCLVHYPSDSDGVRVAHHNRVVGKVEEEFAAEWLLVEQLAPVG